MSLNKFAGMTTPMLIAAFAPATQTCAAADPVPPPSQALHEKLTLVSQDPEKRSATLKKGQKEASVCRHCHGEGGNSVLPEVPNLASQNANYLLEQMNKFVQGQRKSSAFMAGMIKALTPDERFNIALYLSQQPVTRKPAGHGVQSAAGKMVYEKLCANCHGASGTGSQKIPRLAGQQVKYLEESLQRYRRGSGERIDPKMAAYTRNLNDTDIQNLAAFLNAM